MTIPGVRVSRDRPAVSPAGRCGLALVTNRLPRQRDVVIRSGGHVTVDGPAGDPIQAGGGVVGRLPARMRMVPKGAMLLVPAA